MIPRSKTRIERELDVAKMNARDLRSSNLLLARQLDDKDSQLLVKNQEISQLKSMIANSANTSESIGTKAVPHNPPNQQLTDKQVRRPPDPEEQHEPNSKRRKPRPLSDQDEPLKAIQRLLENAERQKEMLRQNCETKKPRIIELEAERDRIIYQNDVQHSQLQDCLGEKAALEKKYDYLHECHQKLQAENTKVAGSKRSLAIYLNDVGFTKDDFTMALEHSSKSSSPKNDASACNAEYDYPETPTKHHTTMSETLQPKPPIAKSGPGTVNAELENKKDNFDSGVDDNTIIVVRKVKENTPDATDDTLQASFESEVQGTDIDEGVDVDVGDVEDVGHIKPESETDVASEYSPANDWEMETESDRETSSVEDSDYQL